MTKFNEVKLLYTCPSFPPEWVHMDRVYSIDKNDKGFFLTDGVSIEVIEEDQLEFIKMLFTPKDVDWSEVDFENEVKIEKAKTIEITEDK